MPCEHFADLLSRRSREPRERGVSSEQEETVPRIMESKGIASTGARAALVLAHRIG